MTTPNRRTLRWSLLVLVLAAAGSLPWPVVGGSLLPRDHPEAPLEPGSPQALRGQLLELLGVRALYQAGARGQGVKVAILDSGFRGYRDHLGKALPRQVTVKSFRQDENFEAQDSQHGIL